MARPRKIKVTKVSKSKKVKTKKVKNSFLQINKLYEFCFETMCDNDSITGKLKDLNKEEILLESLNGLSLMIIKKSSVYMVREYDSKELAKEEDL